MHRVNFSSHDLSGQTINVTDTATVHHCKDVIRLSKGEQVIAFDERGNEYLCEVAGVATAMLKLRIHEKLPPRIAKSHLTLACALPKRSKFDDIVDVTTQLGVDRIIPLKTERVEFVLSEKRQMHMLERWKRIALSASKQSHRNTVPVIDGITDVKQLFCALKGFDKKIIPTLLSDFPGITFQKAMANHPGKDILVCIGPEGDFTAKEVAMAVKSGCIPVTLGELVFRVDTAASACVSFIRLSGL